MTRCARRPFQRITGASTGERLAIVLRAGALPAKVKIVEARRL